MIRTQISLDAEMYRHAQLAAKRAGISSAGPRRDGYTSLAVLSEAYGWFLHRLGEQSAGTFRLLISELPNLRLVPLDVPHHQEVVSKLDQLRGHKLTYVDASSLVILSRYRIKEVWGQMRISPSKAHVSCLYEVGA